MTYPSAGGTGIETTFDNLVIGKYYHLSFYYAINDGFKAESLEVSLGDQSVYSSVPTSNVWTQVSTKTITADATSLIANILVKGNNNFISFLQVVLESSSAPSPTIQPTNQPSVITNSPVAMTNSPIIQPSMKPTSSQQAGNLFDLNL
jgi:hypothetical protein